METNSPTYTTLQSVPFDNYNSINALSDNVGPTQELLHYFLGSASQMSQNNELGSVSAILQTLDELVAQPKDTFVSKLLDITNGNTEILEILRLELLKSAKTLHDFPYERSSLKRRLERRSKEGDTLSVKLARDCFVLKLASNGSYLNELNDVLTCKSAKPSTSTETANPIPNVCNITVQENVCRIDRDLITLRGEYVQEKERTSKAIATVNESNTKLNDMTVKHSKRLQNLQDQVNIIRDGKIQKNQSLLEARIEALEKRIIDSDELKKEVSCLSETVTVLSKSVTDMKTTQEKQVSAITHVRNSIKQLTQDAKNESVRVNNISDERASGVSSLRAKMDLVNDKLKDNETVYENLESLVASCAKSVSDFRKRINNIQKNEKTREERTFADVTKMKPNCDESNSPSISNKDCLRSEKANNESQHHAKITSETILTQTEYQCQDRSKPIETLITKRNKTSFGNSDAFYSERSQMETNDINSTRIEMKPTKSRPDESPATNRIPVHMTNDANMVSIRENAEFHGISRKRVDRYFVSGIRKDSTEEGMRSYLEDNKVRVTFVRFFDSYRQNVSSYSAQLNVRHEDSHILFSHKFWPDGMRIRRWIPKSKFYNRERYSGYDQNGNFQSEKANTERTLDYDR